jgi:hypothetical protein
MGGTTAGRAHVASVVVPRPDTLARGRGFLDRVNTTPGRLRVASIVLVGGLVLTWVVVLSVVASRQRASVAVVEEATPLLRDASALYVALAEADATASRAFLLGGPESDDLQARIDEAIARLTTIGGHADTSAEVRESVTEINAGLNDYAERVAAAGANSRQNFVVAAAYLRDASRIMTGRILPAATDLYAVAASELDESYRAGTSRGGLLAVVAAGVVVVAMLVAIQLWIAGWSNRVFNLGLVGASVVVVGLLGWALVLFAVNQNQLVQAQREDSDAVQLLSAARILGLRAVSDDYYQLIERGTGAAYGEDFDVVMDSLGGAGGRGGLLGEFARTADSGQVARRADELAQAFRAFLDEHEQVRRLDDAGKYPGAVDHALGELADSAEVLDHRLSSGIDSARQSLDARAGRAAGGFTVLAVGSSLIAAMAILFVLYGLRQRIEEYR